MVDRGKRKGILYTTDIFQSKSIGMDRRVQYAIYIVLVIGALFGVLFMRSSKKISVEIPISTEYTDGRILGGTTLIAVSIATTETTRQQGLSNTPSLPAYAGKFFVFDTDDRYGFWMKDMHYALDIVWIDQSMHVIAISINIDPSTYPSSFYPPSPIRYVLELNANSASLLGIAVGTKLTLLK